MKEITVKLRQVGKSVGCIFPQEELRQMGRTVGDTIKIKIENDESPFWDKVALFTKEERRQAMTDEDFGQNDLSEWENL